MLIALGMASDAEAHTAPGLEAADASRKILLAGVAFAGITFAVGWARLRQRRAARFHQLVFQFAGLLFVGLALLSPIDRYAASSFIVHMIQHELLIMAACPCLLLANPLPVYLWGLPGGLRRSLGRTLAPAGALRTLLQTVTRPRAAWTLFVASLWFWHHPTVYDAALRLSWLHDLEHTAFFVTGLLFWWPIVEPAPHLDAHLSPVGRILYLMFALLQNAALSGLILLSPTVLYPHYETVAPLWGLSPLEDQLWGGFVMWVAGSMMYLLAVMFVLLSALDAGGKSRVAVPHRPGIARAD